jgi:hypothetical protein
MIKIVLALHILICVCAFIIYALMSVQVRVRIVF